MKEQIHEALGLFTYGIYILTSQKGDEKHGMIVSWVSQISHDPPLVMAAIRKNRRMHPIVEEAGSFVLHVLDKDAKQIVSRFKYPSPAERFAGVECATGATGAPIIKNVPAYAECRLRQTFDTGDHTLFIGEVVSAGVSGKGAPMTGWDYGKIYQGDS
ncbi:MAG: flavin reductase [Candidatus Abyssobacteria bacterium SURF_5]|uniref:Flavin reductase n=1 Tax=Abyssobacteria bacterium (strain SURF_5) TaxID=2093360 RepID=A0A3A4N6I4_ABYX5|nr:MAG: flavin reductase [Candidatus Abyssubacteria bacterium SURF_5]